MKKLALLFALPLAALPALAQAAQPCLSPAEASSLAAYALPSAITGTTKRCAAALPSSAFLKRGGASLSARYGATKLKNWPAAKVAFLKMSAKDQNMALLAGLPDPSLQQMLDLVIEGMVAQQIPVERCGEIDKLVGLIAPLPPENTAELIATLIGLTAKSGDATRDKFAICKS